jgi:hypothetical protein
MNNDEFHSNVERRHSRITLSGVDGLDHINIHNKDATTELGKLLRTHAETPFVHPVAGPFRTFEGFWHQLRCSKIDDRFRTIAPKKACALATNLGTRVVENFRELIMDATYEKIVQNKRLRELFVESSLPFKNYWMFTPRLQTPPEQELRAYPISATGLNFMVAGLEDLRKVMKSGFVPHKPDYRKLMPEYFL